MTQMNRLRLNWTGFIGAPGLTTFYFQAGTNNMGPMDSFITAIRPYLPPVVTIAPTSVGDIIEDSNGQLQGTWVPINLGTKIGSATETHYSAPTGGLVKWPTTSAIAGRRVEGKTFLVPLSNIAYDVDGSLLDTVQAIIQQAARTMVSSFANSMLVWARPFTPGPDNPPAGQPGHKVARLGQAVQVVTANVPQKAVVLRSRRD